MNVNKLSGGLEGMGRRVRGTGDAHVGGKGTEYSWEEEVREYGRKRYWVLVKQMWEEEVPGYW